MHINTILAEMAIRRTFGLSNDILVYPMWYHPHYSRWTNYYATSNARYFKVIPGKKPIEILGQIDSGGYHQIIANNATIHDLSHRIIHRLFIGDIPDGYHVHHRDGYRLNNTPENLQAISPADHRRLPRRPPNRLTDRELATVEALAGTGWTVAQIADHLSRTHRQISRVLNRKNRRQEGPWERAGSPLDGLNGLPGTWSGKATPRPF